MSVLIAAELWGAVAQVVRAPAALAGGHGFDPWRLPWIFFFFLSSSWLTNADEMKDLWCSSTVRLLSTQT